MRWPMLVPAFVLRPERSHARLTMEVEDSGGVVLTAYHSYARPPPPSPEPRCAPRATASLPGSRYPHRPPGTSLLGWGGGGWWFHRQLGLLPEQRTTIVRLWFQVLVDAMSEPVVLCIVL